MLRDLLSQLSRELNLEPFRTLGKHLFALQIHPQIELSCHELDPGVAFSSPITPLPSRHLEDLFLLLMRANYLGRGTGDAKIGLSSDEKTLTLTKSFPYEMSYEAFRERVENFVNYLVYWREEVAQFERERR